MQQNILTICITSNYIKDYLYGGTRHETKKR